MRMKDILYNNITYLKKRVYLDQLKQISIFLMIFIEPK